MVHEYRDQETDKADYEGISLQLNRHRLDHTDQVSYQGWQPDVSEHYCDYSLDNIEDEKGPVGGTHRFLFSMQMNKGIGVNISSHNI